MNVESIVGNAPNRLSPEESDKALDIDLKRESLAGKIQDRNERKKYAVNIFWLLVGFLIVTLGITIASGTKALCFHLSDNVLIALLTTTSADVIGIFIFVVKYLFKASKE